MFESFLTRMHSIRFTGMSLGIGILFFGFSGCTLQTEAEKIKHSDEGSTVSSKEESITKETSKPTEKSAIINSDDEFPVPAPPFSEGIFPCSQCHADMEPNPTRRELEEHDNIKLNHGPRDRWCFDCHNPKDRDKLRLASGTLVPFSESYRLCGQCHGPELRDWRFGVHGKRTGQWDGKKNYLLCAHCHDPHSPQFKPIKPMPPPMRPEDIH